MLEANIFSRYAFPEQIHSDRGAQFTSGMFQEVCRRLHIKKTETPAYNPKSNPVERSHKDMKSVLKALLEEVSRDTSQDWEELLPTALLALRTARNRHTGVTPLLRHVRPGGEHPS